MTISIGADHGAYELKCQIVEYLKSLGHSVLDYGTNSIESCDYPDFAYPAAKAVSDRKADYGIVMCTTGIGVSIVANKVKGVRCALVYDPKVAKITREHNNPNVLALGANITDFDTAKEIINTFLGTDFSYGERHVRRVEKIIKMEEK